MANNTILNPGAGGDTIATEDIAGVKYEIVKVAWGSAGAATLVDAANPLPITSTTLSTAAKQDTEIAGLASIDGRLITLNTNIDVALSTRASEATLALIKAKTDNLDVLLSTRLKAADTLAAVTNLTQFNGSAIVLGPGVRTAGTLRATIATDDVVPVTNANLDATLSTRATEATLALIKAKTDNLDVLLSTRLKAADTLAAVTSLTQMNGVAIAMNTGVRAAGVQRVTIATDDLLDVSDRAAREVGRVRLWDGTDELTLLPLRTAPGTEKIIPVMHLPNRLPIYGAATTTVIPAITIGVKELMALWHVVGSTKDKYILEITASGLIVTASTATGRSALRVSTITTAPTGGTEAAKADIAGAGASDMTNTMIVKTGGGAIGSTFIRNIVEFATSPIGRIEVVLFRAPDISSGMLMRAGSATGFSIDLEREVAHTTLVDAWTVTVRWIEL